MGLQRVGHNLVTEQQQCSQVPLIIPIFQLKKLTYREGGEGRWIYQKGRRGGERASQVQKTTGAKAELHEPRASISVRKPSVRQVQRAGGQDTGGPHGGEWSALPCPATLEPKAKGKKKISLYWPCLYVTFWNVVHLGIFTLIFLKDCKKKKKKDCIKIFFILITEFVGTCPDGLNRMPESSRLLDLAAYKSNSNLCHSPVPEAGGSKSLNFSQWGGGHSTGN